MNNYSKKLVQFTNLVFLIFIFLAILILFFSLYKIIYSPKNYDISFYIYCLLIASVLIVFFLFCLIKLKIDLKLNLSIFLITIFLSIYFSEIYLEFRGKNKDIIGSPKVLDPNYDTRTKEEVIDSFKINNIETYPSIPIAQFISSSDSFSPLSHSFLYS